MRRAVLTLGGTVAGLAALFSFKTHTPGLAAVTAPSTPAGLSVTAPPMTNSNGSSSAATSSATPSKTATKTAAPAKSATPKPTAMKTTAPATTPTSSAPTTPAPKPTTSSAAPTTRTLTGQVEQTRFGEVQVQITVTGTKITSAIGSQPQGGSSIGQNAIPQLNSEVIAAQSANIQTVSGATYTSQGYIQSLQSALDQIG